MAKISIASRRKIHQTFPESSVSKIAVMPQNLQMETDVSKIAMMPQNVHMETDVKFELTKEEIAKFFSNLNRALLQQEHIQFIVTLTRTDTGKIKIDAKSQLNGDDKRILKSDEVCDMLKITKRVLHRYAKKGVIPGLKVGREWRFEADSIFKLLKEV